MWAVLSCLYLLDSKNSHIPAALLMQIYPEEAGLTLVLYFGPNKTRA